MAERLRKIRKTEKQLSLARKIITTVLIFLFGAGMGLLAKYVDTMAFNELPGFLQAIDIVNFLGRFAIWIFIAVCISVYSNSWLRAALNTFLFFVGMVGCYYLYSAFVAGFFPRSYAMIWIAITCISPFLAVICWYAKGNGWIAVALSAVILGVLFSQAVLLFQGIRITFVPEVVVWLASVFVLRRKKRLEFAVMIGGMLAVAVLYQLFIPFYG